MVTVMYYYITTIFHACCADVCSLVSGWSSGTDGCSVLMEAPRRRVVWSIARPGQRVVARVEALRSLIEMLSPLV